MKRIKLIVDTYGVNALKELAKVSRNFGIKPEDVVTPGQGVVEAGILEGAAKGIPGQDYCLSDILNACTNAVTRRFICEVADGTNDDTTKLRALLALRSSLYMLDVFWDLEIDDIEEETKVARKLFNQLKSGCHSAAIRKKIRHCR